MKDFIEENKALFDELDLFIDALPTIEGSLIHVLHHAQQIFTYLPKEVQLHIAKRLDVSPAKIYGVVSFYSYFTTKPCGKYKISVCTGTVCFVKGADKILKQFEDELGIKSGETTEDLLFSLNSVRCVGACGLAPVVTINDKVYGNVKVEDVRNIIDGCVDILERVK